MKFGMGQGVRRKEDVRLLKGAGTYTDDVLHDAQAHGHVLRSPVAHARITAIDVEAARGMPGVLAVYIAADPGIAALNPIKTWIPVQQPDGSMMPTTVQTHLAEDRVRYVGEPVAFVVAETRNAARDAAEAIEVEFDELPAAVTPEAAVAQGAPLIHDNAPGNIAYLWESGDEAATDAAFAKAARVVKARVVNPRIIVNAMEPRAINCVYDAAEGRWSVHCATQGSHAMRGDISKALKVDAKRVRVLTPDVGGGFGMKLMYHPEYALCAHAAKEIGRPVKWTADRSESFLADLQGRDITTMAEAALDEDGVVLAVRWASYSNLGAYASAAGPGIHTAFSGDLAVGTYRIPTYFNRVKGVYTTTTPTDAYRGAGRPESAYIVERLMDRCGAETGLGPVEIRRRNLIRAEDIPYTAPGGYTFDSGDFPKNLDDALKAADADGFAARRTESESRGRRRGMGLIYYMERTGGGPDENATIEVFADGRVMIACGTQSTGQGHETAWAQVVHEKLGVPFESIEMRIGDSDELPIGGGTGGSRSLIVAGRSFVNAAEDTISKARRAAADVLEAAEADIEYDPEAGGVLRIAGTDRSISIFEAAANARQALGAEAIKGAGEVHELTSTFPNGCHIAEVEVDPQTGQVEILGYTICDDFGVIINPMLVKGQVQGGVGQGIGEALLEIAVYDEETGQPVTGSYMDYAMPRAGDVSDIDVNFNEFPCTTNPLGAKGCGEAGCVAAAPAIVNAALDAVRGLGVDDLQMPLTPQSVWRAIREAAA